MLYSIALARAAKRNPVAMCSTASRRAERRSPHGFPSSRCVLVGDDKRKRREGKKGCSEAEAASRSPSLLLPTEARVILKNAISFLFSFLKKLICSC